MQFYNMKDYSGIKPIISSRFEVGIIHVEWEFISIMPSLLLYMYLFIAQILDEKKIEIAKRWIVNSGTSSSVISNHK